LELYFLILCYSLENKRWKLLRFLFNKFTLLMQMQLLIKSLESWVERVKINLVVPTFNKLRIKISEKQFSLINRIVYKSEFLG